MSLRYFRVADTSEWIHSAFRVQYGDPVCELLRITFSFCCWKGRVTVKWRKIEEVGKLTWVITILQADHSPGEGTVLTYSQVCGKEEEQQGDTSAWTLQKSYTDIESADEWTWSLAEGGKW